MVCCCNTEVIQQRTWGRMSVLLRSLKVFENKPHKILIFQKCFFFVWFCCVFFCLQNPKTSAIVKQLVAEGNVEELQKCFGLRMEFGTAGLRAAMGAGISHMNDLTIIQTTQVLCSSYYLVQLGGCRNGRASQQANGHSVEVQVFCLFFYCSLNFQKSFK